MRNVYYRCKWKLKSWNLYVIKVRWLDTEGGGGWKGKKDRWRISGNFLPEDFEGVHPLNYSAAKYLPLPAGSPLPHALMTFSSSRSSRESLRSGLPEKGKKKLCAQTAATWRSSAMGRLSTGPSSMATTNTFWSPSPTSSRLPLISPCASQSMSLMRWCPSFTYSIFDLSHFIQLNPAEVDSHRQGTPSLLRAPPPLMFNRMTTKPTTENHFLLVVKHGAEVSVNW